MQNTKPNRAQRRAILSNGKPKLCRNTLPRSEAMARNVRHDRTLHVISNRPQIAAPSRATRFSGMT